MSTRTDEVRSVVGDAGQLVEIGVGVATGFEVLDGGRNEHATRVVVYSDELSRETSLEPTAGVRAIPGTVRRQRFTRLGVRFASDVGSGDLVRLRVLFGEAIGAPESGVRWLAQGNGLSLLPNTAELMVDTSGDYADAGLIGDVGLDLVDGTTGQLRVTGSGELLAPFPVYWSGYVASSGSSGWTPFTVWCLARHGKSNKWRPIWSLGADSLHTPPVGMPAAGADYSYGFGWIPANRQRAPWPCVPHSRLYVANLDTSNTLTIDWLLGCRTMR